MDNKTAATFLALGTAVVLAGSTVAAAHYLVEAPRNSRITQCLLSTDMMGLVNENIRVKSVASAWRATGYTARLLLPNGETVKIAAGSETGQAADIDPVLQAAFEACNQYGYKNKTATATRARLQKLDMDAGTIKLAF